MHDSAKRVKHPKDGVNALYGMIFVREFESQDSSSAAYVFQDCRESESFFGLRALWAPSGHLRAKYLKSRRYFEATG
jgi:hypothetical protein